MGAERNFLKRSDTLKAAHDSLSIALDAAQEYPAYASRETLPTLKKTLSHLEYLAADPSMLLCHTEEEALEEVNERLNRLLRNYGPEDKLAELHYGPLKEALDLLAGLPPQLPQLRDSSVILKEEPAVPSGLVTVLHAATQQLLQRIGSDPREWTQLGPRTFEELLSEMWKGLGWQTVLTPPVRDGGFDIRAIRNENGVSLCYLLEAKAYRPDRPVGIATVRHLYGVVEREHATNGIIATTSTFTRDATIEAETLKYRLTLADFQKVLQWLDEYRKAVKGAGAHFA